MVFSSFTLNIYHMIGPDHGISFRFAGSILRSVVSGSIFPLVFGQAGRASGYRHTPFWIGIGEPRGAAPPTPPGIGVTYTAVRRIEGPVG